MSCAALTHVALLSSPSQLHCAACGLLHVFAQALHLHTLLFVRRSNVHRQQVTQRVHGHVHLTAALAFVAVVACTWITLSARLQCAAVHNDSAGLALTFLFHTDDGAQVLRYRLEAARVQPAQGFEDFA